MEMGLASRKVTQLRHASAEFMLVEITNAVYGLFFRVLPMAKQIINFHATATGRAFKQN